MDIKYFFQIGRVIQDGETALSMPKELEGDGKYD
jgi:hypothetical protein